MLDHVGELEPFSEAWLDQLDRMPKAQAVTWVNSHLQTSIYHQERYREAMVTALPEQFDGLLHAYCIDSNNVIRLIKLLREIANE